MSFFDIFDDTSLKYDQGTIININESTAKRLINFFDEFINYFNNVYKR